MSVSVVVDYFLAGGASFRRSEEWRKSFETAEGKSRIERAGRFGVGALATFLIGLELRATINSDHIELRVQRLSKLHGQQLTGVSMK